MSSSYKKIRFLFFREAIIFARAYPNFRSRSDRRATSAGSSASLDELDLSTRRSSLAELTSPPSPFSISLGSDGFSVSFQNELKKSEPPLFIPPPNEEVEKIYKFHDPCLNCINASYLKGKSDFRQNELRLGG